MNILNEPEKATCQKRAPFPGIDKTLRSQSQLYIKSTCSLSYIFNRFVRFTLCIKVATRSEGNSQFATDRKQNCFLGRPGPQIRFFGFSSWYAFFNHLTLAHRLSFAHSSGSNMLLVWTNLENLNSVPLCGQYKHTCCQFFCLRIAPFCLIASTHPDQCTKAALHSHTDIEDKILCFLSPLLFLRCPCGSCFLKLASSYLGPILVLLLLSD